MDFKLNELRQKAGYNCGTLPASGYIVIRPNKRQLDIMERRIPTEGIFKGEALEQEALKDDAYEVVAVPIDFVSFPERALCQVGDKVMIAGKIEIFKLKDDLRLLPVRCVIAITN